MSTASIGRAQRPACLAHVGALPAQAGIGLKPQHVAELLAERPSLGFVEVHAENYLVAGGPLHQQLQAVAEHYPLSIHGVGLSIGGEQPLDSEHLRRIAGLVERYQPASFSEHLAWSSHGPYFFNDLLPLAYSQAALERVCRHIEQVQEALGRHILLENPATYVQYRDGDYPEAVFIREVIERSGCGLLLDVNNVYVSCVNHRWSIADYLADLPLAATQEIHLAGFSEEREPDGGRLLIDNHGAAVADDVWQLYQQVLTHTGPIATLIEWDNNVPTLQRLVTEAQCAEAYLKQPTQAIRV
ncbi:hypothetical protein SAMN05216214_108175 [Atopomonas hussainii]|uniref:UPF0276 protein SAMN05216214_108175 n=1 Tax=Atopomonas hussainii TaxID=1429083 RepID=A0A1H7MU02_9GAMM|nr:DUF692 domain-containing protein [Atopomonas hussainii]SEL14077.1 hypothetical protein SAMN05216214_108175 [Atopomonas hussainii]